MATYATHPLTETDFFLGGGVTVLNSHPNFFSFFLQPITASCCNVNLSGCPAVLHFIFPGDAVTYVVNYQSIGCLFEDTKHMC